MTALRFRLGTPLAALFFSALPAAQFVVDNAKIPQTGSSTENVDFADIDLDGDFDVAVADGGDDGNDQNRIWVNSGGLQPGLPGQYTDETALRAPVVLDDSRDVEFADIDGDADPDLYVANTSQIQAQGNRWWVNQGGKQSGSLGFYADETSTRWSGLGGPGSSIAPSQVLPGNTFVDWSCDCDFADLDNDGDVDLVHASYGSAFNGLVPTRLFLNDGNGVFSEFNPSGFQLASSSLADGNPGLWCEGVQAANTTNASGAQCDITTTALDVDVGDLDGDFDLDILLGARDELPRVFVNRLNGTPAVPANPGGLLFRDRSGASFPAAYATGTGHYEQELGDLDRDGDLDVVGVNWQVAGFSFNDITLKNDGSGLYSGLTVLAGSAADDQEGDFLDYDQDGDLDLFVTNFSGQDKLYRNNHTLPGTFSFSAASLPTYSAISLDADACDTDNDGDTDVLVAEDNFQDETFLRNTTEVADVHAPLLPLVEALGNQTASAIGDPVRAYVYDNTPDYITIFNPTVLAASVDGIALPAIPARASMGQVFRAVLPGNLVGLVSYRFVSEDRYQNSGSSASVNLTGSYGPSFATSYNSGTAGLAGGVPALAALSVPFSNSTFYLAVQSNAPAGTTAVIALGTTKVPGGTLIPGLFLLSIGGTPLFSTSGPLDAGGDFAVALKLKTIPAGVHVFAQGFVLDPTAGGEVFASSQGLEIVTQ
jgi:hypothetical protein